jgi:hypothetical protein
VTPELLVQLGDQPPVISRLNVAGLKRVMDAIGPNKADADSFDFMAAHAYYGTADRPVASLDEIYVWCEAEDVKILSSRQPENPTWPDHSGASS